MWTLVARAPMSASARTSTLALRTLRASAVVSPRSQHRNAHAISNPTLTNIEQRWESMPPQEQADLWMALRDRMKVDWHDMTLSEKKAAYWIAFGPHGPRSEPEPGEGWKVFRQVCYALIVSLIVFAGTRAMARPPPKTMTKEWQEATNERLKAENIEPITGISSEGYTGPGMVQSKPSGKKPEGPE